MTKITLSLLAAASLIACRGDETVRKYGAEGKIWSLQAINGTAFTDQVTLTFPTPGQIAGDAPCNSYSATMEAPYPWFEIGPVAATKRTCPAIKSESAFFTALTKATLSEVLDDTLVLSNPDGLEMVFKASD